MLVNEQDIMLEAGVEVWLETKMNDDWVVVTVDVGVDSVQTLEDLANCLRELLREGNP